MNFMTCDNAHRRQTRHRSERAAAGSRQRILTSALSGALTLSWMMGLVGCGDSQDAVPPQAVYFDTASKQAVVFPASGEYPAIHPETGQPTLMPAMHCPQCAAWRQVPPPEQLNRSATPALCPRCRSRLQIEGPLPSS